MARICAVETTQRRLEAMINRMLFRAHADAPDAWIERIRFNARQELDAVREFHRALGENQRVSVVCKGQGRIEADPFLFRRAVSNLLSNALRHTPEGGKVTLVVNQPVDQTVVVTVSDTGCGIAPEHLPCILSRLHRPDRLSSDYTAGTGLGLAIVKSIMELHGGAVTVASTVGQGTTFTLRFPASSSAAG